MVPGKPRRWNGGKRKGGGKGGKKIHQKIFLSRASFSRGGPRKGPAGKGAKAKREEGEKERKDKPQKLVVRVFPEYGVGETMPKDKKEKKGKGGLMGSGKKSWRSMAKNQITKKGRQGTYGERCGGKTLSEANQKKGGGGGKVGEGEP